jgi:hypothetical protein
MSYKAAQKNVLLFCVNPLCNAAPQCLRVKTVYTNLLSRLFPQQTNAPCF